jgi:hypothetical protein
MNLGILRGKFSKDTTKPQGILAKRGPCPVATGRSCVSFVEDQVDDFENLRQAGGEFISTRDLERHSIFG